MAFTALFDACVLYPAPLRDLLVQLAVTDLFRAVWTERIQEEWLRNLMANRPDLQEIRLRQTVAAMNAAVPDCLVGGYDALIPAISLPDPDDRHVLAAAVHGRADVIVTSNLRDFPPDVLRCFNIEAQHPDIFVRHVLGLDADALAAVRKCRARLRNPAMSADAYLDALARQGLLETVEFLQERLDAI